MLHVDRVVIAFSNEPHTATVDLTGPLKDLDVQIDIVPRLFDVVGPGWGYTVLRASPCSGFLPFRLSRSSRLLKRSIDVAAAGGWSHLSGSGLRREPR